MPSTASLITKLKLAYPQFKFEQAADYLWSPSEQTIYYTDSSDGHSYLLHELSHGLLGHVDYYYDIELIAMERAAWDKAIVVAKTYDLTIDESVITSTLDSYRDWLHNRSTCPNCGATGHQTDKSTYTCLACTQSWRVNEARICALRRYKV